MDGRAARGKPSERIRVDLPNAAKNVAYTVENRPGQGMKVSSVLEESSKKLQQLKLQAMRILSQSAAHGEQLAGDLQRMGASPKTANRVRDMFASADASITPSAAKQASAAMVGAMQQQQQQRSRRA